MHGGGMTVHIKFHEKSIQTTTQTLDDCKTVVAYYSIEYMIAYMSYMEKESPSSLKKGIIFYIPYIIYITNIHL